MKPNSCAGRSFSTATCRRATPFPPPELNLGISAEALLIAIGGVEIDGHTMIEGSIVAAFPKGASVEIHVQSAIAMTEEAMHGWLIQESPVAVYATARISALIVRANPPRIRPNCRTPHALSSSADLAALSR
jgi:hypothetical protein